MDWNDVRILVEISRTGSFAGAAAVLGISKPTVSRRVSDLEQMAGARLFRRHPAGADLTPAGADLLQRALKIEVGMKEFEQALRGLGRSGNRVVTIQASEGVASYLLAPLIARQALGPLGLAAQRVGIDLPTIRLLPVGSQEVADIRIVWSAPENAPAGRASDKVRKLASIRFVPFFSTAYAKNAPEEPIQFEQLTRHKLVTLNDYQWFQTDRSLGAWNHLVAGAEAGVIPMAWTSMMGHLTVEGAGISLLPTYSTLYTELIRPLPITTPPMLADLWIVAGEEELRDPAVRQCYSALGTVFSAFDW